MKIFFSIFIISISIFASHSKHSVFLQFMYKPSKESINGILINNLESNEIVNSKLIEYYLDKNEIKLANYYSKKNKKIDSELGFVINARLFLKLKKDEDAIKLLKIALFEFDSETSFYLLQNLYYKEKKEIKDFNKIIDKGIEINPYLISYYYSFLAENSSKQKQKELFEQYLSYSNTLDITEKEFKNINLSIVEQLYYLEKIIFLINKESKNQYNWAKKLYLDILAQNPYLINLRRVLILQK